MAFEIKYIELKTGYSDNGPAWIGKVKISKTKTTIYFNNKAFKKSQGINSNYYDLETGENYWISGVKKTGTNRHWAGRGKIIIDQKIITEYLHITNKQQLDMNQFEIADIEDIYPVERIMLLENSKKD